MPKKIYKKKEKLTMVSFELLPPAQRPGIQLIRPLSDWNSHCYNLAKRLLIFEFCFRFSDMNQHFIYA